MRRTGRQIFKDIKSAPKGIAKELKVLGREMYKGAKNLPAFLREKRKVKKV